MNIEITSVSLAPGYFAGFDPHLVDSLLDMSISKTEHRLMLMRAAYANRGENVFKKMVKYRKKITPSIAERISEIAACGQYDDERVCDKIVALFGKNNGVVLSIIGSSNPNLKKESTIKHVT